MAANDIVSVILHYKRNIDKISVPPERALKYEDRLLHCISKLYKLPVKVDHLQQTGVGRTVNSLRKIEGEKGLGDAAKALVAKWKTMVMLEDEAERKQRDESGPSEDEVRRIKLIREAEKIEANRKCRELKSQKEEDQFDAKKTESTSVFSLMSPTSNSINNDKSKFGEGDKKRRNESLEDTSKNKKRKIESRENHSKYMKSNSDESDDDINQDFNYEVPSPGNSPANDNKINSKSHSGSKSNNKSSHKSSSLSSSSAHKSHESSKDDHKKEHKGSSYHSKPSSSKSSSGKSHKPGSTSSHEKKESGKQKKATGPEGIDSQSGASFADALGPMMMKKSPKKKSSHTFANSSPAASEHSSENGGSSSKMKRIEIKEPTEPLFPASDLEPLELNLMSTLPVTTPYYKPNPVYNLPSLEASKKRIQAEEDALFTMMSNKNQRTKVYSGVKGGLSYVPSLYEFCCRVLQQHIDALEYTGGIPYSLLKPVLDGATPAQLYQFEHFNPYIIEDTDHLWNFHVNKEFRNEKRQEYESWRDMYLRCVDEREEKYKAVTANIQKSIAEKSAPVRKAKLAYIDVAKPPRNILRKQIKNGTSKPESSRLLGRNDPEAVKVAAPKQPSSKEPAILKIKPKVAPLMQKTLKSIKMTRFKR